MAAPMSIPISSSSEVGWDGGFFRRFFVWLGVCGCVFSREGGIDFALFLLFYWKQALEQGMRWMHFIGHLNCSHK